MDSQMRMPTEKSEKIAGNAMALSQTSPYMQVVSTDDITPELIKALKPKVAFN
jgi:hypothetical protein